MDMAYQVTARKWRPMVFDDVIGQSHVSDTLRNALAQNRLAHSFIFSGTRGCGKTTTARILARAVNCLSPKGHEPCNACEVCREIIEGRSLDVIEIDGASNNGVEQIRNLRESVRYAPARGSKKVYIIDEVHMLSTGAFNALLKTLEEPPPHVLFIFATTEIHKVPATILSRCQRYDFRRIGLTEITAQLRKIAAAEGIAATDDALLLIAKKGDGSMRDAQSIFDQVVSFCGASFDARQVADALNIVDLELFFRVTDVLKAKDTPAALALVEEVINGGYDVKEFLSGIAEHVRNMIVVRTTGSTQLVEESDVHRARYAADAPSFELYDLLRIMKAVTDAEGAVRFAVQPRFRLEVLMVQLTKMPSSVKIDDLLSELDAWKKKIRDGGTLPRPAVTEPPTVTERPAVMEHPAFSGSAPAAEFRVPSSVEEARPRYTLSAAARTAESPAPAEPAPAPPPSSSSPLTMEQVREQWPAIVDEMRRKKISVGTILGETSPLTVANGILTIRCGDEFHRSTVTRNKEAISETIAVVAGGRLRVDAVIQDPLDEQSAPAPAAAAGTTPPPKTAESTPMDHPLVKALYTEFSAEKVN
ncbi:MAG: DNA polymerase III subunit gamma/tau [Bacteroidetes bacterium]|nr:MAG: DNA polymerase III subunit gamma/tau [Bacteroidota bacterium]